MPRIRNALIVKAHHDNLTRYSAQLEREVQARTAELEVSRLQVIFCLARAAEYRDDTTGRHVIRVGRYTEILARELGFSEAHAHTLGLAAQLHDIGKIGIPDAILLKAGGLTIAEFDQVKRHCDIGNRILQPLDEDECPDIKGKASAAGEQQSLLTLVARIAMTHHERWDGTGYPRGLAGEAIPIEGRITSIADVFDALTTKCPYKVALPTDECLKIMEQGRGTQFDPRIFDALLRRINDVMRIYASQQDPA